MREDEPLSELQLRAIEQASEAFERLSAGLDGPAAPGAGFGPPPPPGAAGAGAHGDPVGEQQLRAAAARTIDLFSGLFQQAFESYVELAQALIRAPLGGAGGPGAPAADLALEGRAGATTCATVWIHNATPAPVPAVALRLTALEADTGARIDPAARFAPAALDVAGGASASALLSLAIPAGTAPGVYFGHVLVTGLPAALAVRLLVDDAGGTS